eukprot:Awhi_evm1s14908
MDFVVIIIFAMPTKPVLVIVYQRVYPLIPKSTRSSRLRFFLGYNSMTAYYPYYLNYQSVLFTDKTSAAVTHHITQSETNVVLAEYKVSLNHFSLSGSVVLTHDTAPLYPASGISHTFTFSFRVYRSGTYYFEATEEPCPNGSPNDVSCDSQFSTPGPTNQIRSFELNDITKVKVVLFIFITFGPLHHYQAIRNTDLLWNYKQD